jgi:hypothetical protein
MIDLDQLVGLHLIVDVKLSKPNDRISKNNPFFAEHHGNIFFLCIVIECSISKTCVGVQG